MVPWALGWGRRVTGWLPPFFFTHPLTGGPFGTVHASKAVPCYPEPLPARDQASDEEKIRKLSLMRSRSDHHFLLRLGVVGEKEP
jgi:hypothetical protein